MTKAKDAVPMPRWLAGIKPFPGQRPDRAVKLMRRLLGDFKPQDVVEEMFLRDIARCELQDEFLEKVEKGLWYYETREVVVTPTVWSDGELAREPNQEEVCMDELVQCDFDLKGVEYYMVERGNDFAIALGRTFDVKGATIAKLQALRVNVRAERNRHMAQLWKHRDQRFKNGLIEIMTLRDDDADEDEDG